MNDGANKAAPIGRFRLVADIALGVAALASVGLAAAIYLVTDDKGTDYAQVVLTRQITRDNLGPAMALFGLALIVMAGILTWFAALYSSFRIAGPLFRFAQNLRNAIADSYALPTAIRRSDLLQEECEQFRASQSAVREHYDALQRALDQCRRALNSSDAADDSSLRRALEQLREVERRATL